MFYPSFTLPQPHVANTFRRKKKKPLSIKKILPYFAPLKTAKKISFKLLNISEDVTYLSDHR